ncbi:MAG: hypothetical protein LBC53_02415 [Spirochaetaceae bacterium]|jgi:hypothetical protein|nr:hypothetical protein [Spirochaetaceae bacterium]
MRYSIKNGVFLAFFLLAISNFSLAVSFKDFVNAETVAELEKSGVVFANGYDDGAKPAIAPNYPPLRKALAEKLVNLKPNVCAEALSLYKKPEGASKSAWTEKERAAVYNETLALSSLRGLRYFSRRRGRMHTLYESSAVVEGPSYKAPLPDPEFSTPPADFSVFVRQKDTKFGDNVYLFNYKTESNAIFFSQTNITIMRIAFIPVISKGNMCSYSVVLDAGDSLLVYAVSLVQAASLPSMFVEQANASVNNRTAALLEWLSSRLKKAFS